MSDDDAMERLLRDAFEGPVPDDGFTDHVMRAVPARRRVQLWPAVAGIAVGGVLCWLFTARLWATLWHLGTQGWQTGEVSTPAIVLVLTMLGGSLLALVWATAEAGER